MCNVSCMWTCSAILFPWPHDRGDHFVTVCTRGKYCLGVRFSPYCMKTVVSIEWNSIVPSVQISPIDCFWRNLMVLRLGGVMPAII